MPQPVRVLVVEDDPTTSDSLRLFLESDGYEVLTESDGPTGLRAALSRGPEVVLLDWMLPGMDGLEVCRRLRRESRVPVILITARTRESDFIEGLDAGADDYVAKPFRAKELLARVRAVRRRLDASPPGRTLAAGDLTLDLESRRVRLAGRELEFTPTEFRVLRAFMSCPGRVLTRANLLEACGGDRYLGDERTIDTHVLNIRSKIEPDRSQPRYIRTVFGVGYRFRDDAD